MMTALSAIGVIALLLTSLILILVLVLLLDYLDKGDKSFMCKFFKKLFRKKRNHSVSKIKSSDKLLSKTGNSSILPHSEKIGQSAHY
jgi:predicted RND superfamily exporter protein